MRNFVKSSLLIMMLITIFSASDVTLSSHGYGSTLVLIAESPASLVEYLHRVREGRYRFILTNNPEKIANLLSNNGVLFEILNKSGNDEIIKGMNPHQLAYTLLYASRLGRRVQAEELPLLSEHARQFETQLSRSGSNTSVVFFSSDGSDYAFLAAYTAILKDASLLDMDASFDPSYLKGITDVIVVTSPLWRGNFDRYTKLINYFTKLDEDPYFDVSFGVLTGNHLETPFLMLLWDVILNNVGLQAFVGISLIEDLPIARKVERISSILGLHSKVYYPDLSYSNLTEDVVKSLINLRRGLIYLSLHGNPYVMALRNDGYPVVTAHKVKQLDMFGSIIITLSCDTLKFSDINNPKDSVAYSFLDSGALAYVGSTKVEFSLKSEFGTSHPDLLILLLMNGSRLGESVKIVNNLKISGSKGYTVESASEVLLGDPTLRIQDMGLPFRISGGNRRYIVEVKEIIPTLFLRLQEDGDPSIVSEIPEIHLEWYKDEEGTFIYITTLSTSYADYFKTGDKIEVKMRELDGSISVISYILILLVVVASLILMLRHR